MGDLLIQPGPNVLFDGGAERMEFFKKIMDEHKMILNTLSDISRGEPRDRRERMDDLVVLVITHMNAEEQSLYKAMEGLDTTCRSLALRHEEEHHIARYLMNEIQDEAINDEHWMAKVQVLTKIASGPRTIRRGTHAGPSYQLL